MKRYILTIPDKLPGLNDFYKAALKNRLAGNHLKEQTEEQIKWYIKDQLKDVHITQPVKMYYSWYEPTKKRDLDNISSFGRKCIQDALVRSDILENDGWKNILGFSDSFYIDKTNPRVVVVIEEIVEESTEEEGGT